MNVTVRPPAYVGGVAISGGVTVPPLLAVADEEAIWALRPYLSHLGVAYAVWEQEDPWGVAGLLAICVERDGVWFDVAPHVWAGLRHGGVVGALTEGDVAAAPSKYQPSTVTLVDGGNAAVTVALGALPHAA